MLDADERPLAGAWVVATREECIGLAHCNTFCVEVKVARTDARGNFSFNSGLRSLDAYKPEAYREGYLLTRGRTRTGRTELVMEHKAADARFSKMDPVSARIAYLVKTANEMSCFSAPLAERAALLPVYQAMFREANSIARYPEQRREARAICREMNWLRHRPSDRSLSLAEEEVQQRTYLQTIEPACNAPIDDPRERELLAAVERGNRAAIRAAAEEKFDFNRRLDGRDPPIIVAARKGSADMVRELAAAGARPDEVGQDGRTALDHMLNDYLGPRERKLVVVRALLEAGADPNRPDIWGYPPVLKFAWSEESLGVLLEHGARIDAQMSCSSFCSERGRTILHVVTDPAVARMAIARGADVNAKATFGMTPLMSARPPEVVAVLLENGADPNIANEGAWTPLMYALQNYEAFSKSNFRDRYREIPVMLVRAGARLDARNQHNVDAFYYTKDEALKQELRELAAKR